MNLLDFIWPHVGKYPPDDSLEVDLKEISETSWGSDTPTFLEEARRLRDIETQRKDAAETKSQIYLAALLALIPILVSLTEHSAFKGILAFDKWYGAIGFFLFALGVTYGIGAFISSFRVLTVRAYHRVDVGEIVQSGGSKDPIGDLTKEILGSVRRDRRNVNHKISYVVVTHQLVFRMALLLLLALALVAFSPSVEGIIKT